MPFITSVNIYNLRRVDVAKLLQNCFPRFNTIAAARLGSSGSIVAGVPDRIGS